VCRRLWTEAAVEHSGEFYSFPAVSFEPKPVQRPHPPIHIGGESPVAMRRALKYDGWIGGHHTVESAPVTVARLRQQMTRTPPCAGFEITVAAEPGTEEAVPQWRHLGLDRLIVAPWTRSAGALEGLAAFAARHIS
jgi:alkanesulfonate monooxygenase SsuD/methylene tetrahydromethanopterin reductase-like flavin-dependent oxidoreductase (luciferase family)